MKFKDWSVEDLSHYINLLPTSDIINPNNKIEISGEITVKNNVPKDKENNND